MYYYESSGAALFEIVGLFNSTLQQVLAVPELALFLGTAILLIVMGIFSWIFRRGKRM